MPIVIEADGFEETAERVDKMILQLRELRGYEIGPGICGMAGTGRKPKACVCREASGDVDNAVPTT
jgi:hypothetical protein